MVLDNFKQNYYSVNLFIIKDNLLLMNFFCLTVFLLNKERLVMIIKNEMHD